jgi:hypothetical protein
MMTTRDALPTDELRLQPASETVQIDMDVVKAVETYITKMASVPSAMKVLLLDSHTVRTSQCSMTPLLVEPRRSRHP